jgi:integrase
LEILRPLEKMPLHKITRPFIFALRDTKILPRRGTWHANYVVTVMRILLGFAHDRGWIAANPLSDRIKKIKVARQGGPANRPWSADECRAVLERAPPQLAIPIALAMFRSLRKSDVLATTTAAIRGSEITVRTSKRGRQISVPLHPILISVIKRRSQSDAVQIAVNSHGLPWTESGFSASFRKFKIALEIEGLIGKGLTVHGPRHTLGIRLREAGADDRTIADILGQKSATMARHYSESARLPDRARELLMNLDPTGARNKC